MGNESGGERVPPDYTADEKAKLLVKHIQKLTPTNSITFGELFYNREVEQSFESLPDILKLARARRLIDFEGSVLVMPQHKDVVISIVDSQSNQFKLTQDGILLELNQRSNRVEAALRKFEAEFIQNWSTTDIIEYRKSKIESQEQFLEKWSQVAQGGVAQVSTAGGTMPLPTLQSVQSPTGSLMGSPVSPPKRTKSTRERSDGSRPLSNSKTLSSSSPRNTSSSVVQMIRGIMNKVYKVLLTKFSTSADYGSEYILNSVRETIVATTLEFSSEKAVKDILNAVFKELKQIFDSTRRYTGEYILDEIKQLIIRTTNSLVSPDLDDSLQQSPRDPSYAREKEELARAKEEERLAAERERQLERERIEREKEALRERERQLDREEKERKEQRDRESARLEDRERERLKDEERERERAKEKEREREEKERKERKAREKEERERAKEEERQAERERELAKEREREREREEKERKEKKEKAREREEKERAKEEERQAERERELALEKERQLEREEKERKEREKELAKQEERERAKEEEKERAKERDRKVERLKESDADKKGNDRKSEKKKSSENPWRKFSEKTGKLSTSDKSKNKDKQETDEEKERKEKERELREQRERDREAERERERQKDREMEREREKHRERDLEKQREREAEKERERERQKDRELEKEKEKQRELEKEKENKAKELEKEKEKQQKEEKERQKEAEREKERQKEVEKEKQRERDRAKEREKENIRAKNLDATPKSSVVKTVPVTPDPEQGDDGNQGGNKDKLREVALKRIKQTPKDREVDLRDPEILNNYLKIRDNNDPLNWMILSYDPVLKDKLIVLSTGEGDWEEFYDAIPDNKSVYMYFNYKFGDTSRMKSVFMSYVPDSLNGLVKARVVGHRGDIEAFLKYNHISWHCLSYDEIDEAVLKKMLLAAGGANYSVQEENKGDFSGYKSTTRAFYHEKDKNTSVKAVYHTGPLSTTPMDISGRAMVASQTEFKQNIK